MNHEHYAACLDIGGTSIKSGIVKRDGALLAGSFYQDPVDSGGTAEQILKSFADSLQRALSIVQKRHLNLDGIGIAICGPFDYDRGISKIKDLDKYESLYDVNVKQALQNALQLPSDLPMLFDVDAWSFESLRAAPRPDEYLIPLDRARPWLSAEPEIPPPPRE